MQWVGEKSEAARSTAEERQLTLYPLKILAQETEKGFVCFFFLFGLALQITIKPGVKKNLAC